MLGLGLRPGAVLSTMRRGHSSSARRGLKMGATELLAYAEDVFPQVRGQFSILNLTESSILVRMHVGEQHLRPGGIVNGPAMFTLADCTMYFLTLAHAGRVPLAVTTNCSIDFLRKPEPADMFARARLLKLGRTLCVGDALLFSDGAEDRPVARASLTYAIPQPQGLSEQSAD